MKSTSKIIAWWSGGITSAVTCKLCVDLYGIDNVRFVFIDTKNEDEDTYRFKIDCEKWYNKEIETITGIGDKYNSIEEVWIKNKSLNVASGAVCSSELKRRVREKWQKDNEYTHQAFGFELDEVKRAKSMTMNNPNVKAIYPLLMYGLQKKDCIDIVEQAGIEIPKMYQLGFKNNNCFNTGCVQGGIGYWQKMQRDFPLKFDKMAEMEHRLTDLKGTPVTMLKDQSETGGFVFLKPHPNFDFIKDISKMKGREPEPLFECNGFCGINDLSDRKATENEINFQISLF
jgi:3'-phosphoadenosine 5'-phosphosulfate sulfotransferase (PAPS reductase)/FAD synthetase